MKKYMALFLVALSVICPMEVFAATGNMKVQLPVDVAEAISCTKVGTMVNGVFVLEEAYEESRVNLNELKTAGELEEAAGILMEYEKSGSIFPLEEEGTTLIQGLEEGVYLIHGYGKTSKDISPALVFLPTWMEEEQELLYDITVVPKYSEPAPDTGHRSLEWMYGGLLAASALLLAGSMRGRLRKTQSTLRTN